jgi:hypothetical protein
MNTSEAAALLQGFTITRCAILVSGEAALVAQDRSYPDPLEPKETRIFVYKPFAEPEAQWGSAGIGTTVDTFVCPSVTPGERWLFCSERGDVFVVGDNSADFEAPLDSRGGFIFGARSLKNVGSYFVGPNRRAILRRNDSDRVVVELGGAENTKAGFRDIDGFSANDVYACGGIGDLWRFDGRIWSQIAMPENAFVDEYTSFDRVCCGSNGLVHILANASRRLFVGAGDEWRQIRFDNFEALVGDIGWYGSSLLLVAERECYEYCDGIVIKNRLMAACPLEFYSRIAHAEDKLLVVNGAEGAYFDGATWTRFL